MSSFTCAAILFDLDGVLVDSTASVERHWRLWAAEHQIDVDRLLAVAHGRRTSETIRLVAPELESAAEVDRIEHREAEDTDGVKVMPGAHKLVRSIPNGRWSIVTSGTRHLATTRLKLVGIPIPEGLITAENVYNGKPHPEPYLAGARMLGVAPKDCIVIEDAPAGIESGRVAGARVIALANTYPAAELRGADAIVYSLEQVHVHLDGALRIELN